MKVLIFSKESDTWEAHKESFQKRIQEFTSRPKEKTQFFPMDEKILTCVQLALEEHYQGLETFYFDIFQKSQNYDLICFVARRSLVLSEIFYSIWLYKCKITLEQEKTLALTTKFCSDSTLISIVGTWGDKVGKVALPAVLLVDELIMQGNAVNSILTEMEESLLEDHLKQGGELAFSALQQELVQSISVRIFCGSVNSYVFHPNYQQKLLIETPASEEEWHRFSLHIARLCQDLPITNVAFTLGLRLESWMNQRLTFPVPQFQPLPIMHSDLTERVFFYENNQGILGTVRGVYHKSTREINLIPLIFLPDCPKDLFEEIAEEIYERWLGNLDGADYFPKESRSYYEGIMLFLNCSLLQLFLQKAFHLNMKTFTLESFKMKANFNVGKHIHWDDVLDNLVNPSILLDEESLVHYIRRISQNNTIGETQESSPEKMTPTQALYYLENEVYLKKILEMQYSHKKQLGFYRTPNTSRTGRNFHIDEILGKDSHLYRDSKIFRAWMLQFMDRGILTMKIREKEDMVCQFLRTGEASVFLFPIRYQNYIPNLLYYERHSFGDNELFLQYMLEFQEEMKDVRPELVGELYMFYQYLTFSNQSLSAWDINMNTEINYRDVNML